MQSKRIDNLLRRQKNRLALDATFAALAATVGAILVFVVV